MPRHNLYTMLRNSNVPRAWLRDLDPACFALVMATGIVSRAMRLDGADVLSAALLVVGVAAFVVLTVAYAWRFAAYRGQCAADARDPRRAFGYFTFGAAAAVLSASLAADGYVLPAAVLLFVLGAAGWLLPSYALPMLLGGPPAAARTVAPTLAGATGTWFVWAVGVQSVAVAATAFRPPVPAAIAALAICCWMVGVVLYLVIAVLVTVARFESPLRPTDPTASYWVFMGATAISVLAAAQLLRLRPDALLSAVRPVLSGVSVMLWAFGTWLIPLLIALAVWRHLLRRVPLGYHPGLWSMVFPVGMYGVASRELGAVLRQSWLVTLGRYEAWAGLAVWAALAAAMSARAALRVARGTRTGKACAR